MKKLLLVSTAIAGVAMLSSPASAALKMDLGGYFDGYGVYADNHEAAGANTGLHKYDLRRDTEVHVNGETTLDNGLTVGAHSELRVGNNDAQGTANAGSNFVMTDEVYGYGSGGWGRVNLGQEDGAAYLLQVAAPSADSNVDGLRTYIQALNPITGTQSAMLTTFFAGTNAFSAVRVGALDYQQSDFRQTDRITYLTPKFNGFQGGVSYATQPGLTSATGKMSGNDVVDAGGLSTGTAAAFKNLWDAAARWDGEFQGFGLSAGAGYSSSSLAGTQHVLTNGAQDLEQLTNGVKSWNGGLSGSYAGFSLGGVYKETKVNVQANTLAAGDAADVGSGNITGKTWVAGLGYDNGPFHVGASYLHDRTREGAISGDTDTILAQTYTDTKYTFGGGYTYGPGMTFRGSVAWGKFEAANGGTAGGVLHNGNDASNASNRYQQVAIGTDIQF